MQCHHQLLAFSGRLLAANFSEVPNRHIYIYTCAQGYCRCQHILPIYPSVCICTLQIIALQCTLFLEVIDILSSESSHCSHHEHGPLSTLLNLAKPDKFLLYPRPTKLEGGYTGFTLSVCPSGNYRSRKITARRWLYKYSEQNAVHLASPDTYIKRAIQMSVRLSVDDMVSGA